MTTEKKDDVELQIEPLYLKREKAAAYLSISESAFCAAVSSGQLPKPRKILGGRVGWLVKELRDWGLNRPVSDAPPPPNSGYGRAGKPA